MPLPTAPLPDWHTPPPQNAPPLTVGVPAEPIPNPTENPRTPSQPVSPGETIKPGDTPENPTPPGEEPAHPPGHPNPRNPTPSPRPER